MNERPHYDRIFDPPLKPPAPATGQRIGDRTTGESNVYVYDEEIVLAVNVALATGRPLLVRGLPGRGKSRLAPNVADQLGRRFYSMTISSRTQARDLKWTVDEVARLSDASAGTAAPRSHYVVPGALWWAFEPETAARRGLPEGETRPPLTDPNQGTGGGPKAVVLLDEIDKADPDVPNDLLESLGSYQFQREDGPVVEASTAPLVVLTTNEERELPKAFLRRCVVLVLQPPGRYRLLDIAEAHFGPRTDALYDDILQSFGVPAAGGEGGVEVSTAEFLDAIAAAVKLDIVPGHELWPSVIQASALKPEPELR
ncbi:AAA family ATPase [Streptomyces sp. NPDC001549]|uniref:AAA family ATPase n=1 Tax=Streptomyces sp. NPDC001549 TaxID=3364586 RepID=UPI00369E3EF4